MVFVVSPDPLFRFFRFLCVLVYCNWFGFILPMSAIVESQQVKKRKVCKHIIVVRIACLPRMSIFMHQRLVFCKKKKTKTKTFYELLEKIAKTMDTTFFFDKTAQKKRQNEKWSGVWATRAKKQTYIFFRFCKKSAADRTPQSTPPYFC